jgi:Predicted membrane protein (DUF2232)
MNTGLTPQTIGIGVLAGAATALLCLGLASGSTLAILLFFISPVPLMVTGLGFGLKPAAIGGVVAIAATFMVANGLVAVLVALGIAAPACASGFWLNLARPADEIGGPKEQLAWYPLSDVLFAFSIIAGTTYVVMGALIGFGPELAGELTSELVARFRETNPELVFTPEGQESLRQFMESAIPFAQPFFWMLTLTLSLYISLAIARRSGLIRRPRDDWPMALRLPRKATFALAAAILAGFAPGSLGLAASTFTGALAAGFTMAGFAMAHARTRGMNGRTPILILAYLSVIFVAFTALLFFVAGIFGASRHVPLSPVSANKRISDNHD